MSELSNELRARAERVAQHLKERRETIAVAESSTGGLVSAALLAVPGASAYFIGGAVVYTQAARRALLDIPDFAMTGMRASTEAYALLLAPTARQLLGRGGCRRARHHDRDRQPGSYREHAGLHGRGTRPAGGGAGRRLTRCLR